MTVMIKNNIFKETKVKDPAVVLFKAELAQTILDIVARRKYKQQQAAEALGVSQPVVSDLANGKLHKFTVDRLLHFLFLLGWHIRVEVGRNHTGDQPSLVYANRT